MPPGTGLWQVQVDANWGTQWSYGLGADDLTAGDGLLVLPVGTFLVAYRIETDP